MTSSDDVQGYAQRAAERRAEPRYEGELAASFTHAAPDGVVRAVQCEVTSLSASAMVVRSAVHGQVGEHIWVELGTFGLVRCEIEAIRDDGFVCANLIKDEGRRRLGAWVSLLRRRGGRPVGDHRQFMRTRPRDARTAVTFVDGTTLPAQLSDISRSGAAVASTRDVVVGEAVSVGRVPAHIVRIFDGGFAVAFDIVLEAADADRLVAGYEVTILPTRKAI